MEKLKSLFEGKALTFEEFSKAMESCEELKLVDLLAGEYVDSQKAKLLETEIESLKEQHQREIGEIYKASAVEQAVIATRAKNATAVKALLNLGQIELNEGKLTGIEEQLGRIKTENPFLFESGEIPPPPALDTNEPNAVGELSRWREEAGL